MDVLVAAVSFGGPLLALYVKAYFDSRGKKEGEIAAIRDNLREVVRQLRETTRATEEIKTVIGEDLWVRQEQWKLKRDTYLKAANAAGELFNVQLRIHQAELVIRGGTTEERAAHLRELSELQNKVLADFRGARAAAAIVLAEEATAVMDAYQLVSSQRDVDSPDFYKSGMDALNRTYAELIRLARLETQGAGCGGRRETATTWGRSGAQRLIPAGIASLVPSQTVHAKPDGPSPRHPRRTRLPHVPPLIRGGVAGTEPWWQWVSWVPE